MLGLLAIWLLPTDALATDNVAADTVATEVPSAPHEEATLTSSNIPADYPEDFSRPETLAAAPPAYEDAFGEDEVVATSEDLMRPLDEPARTPSQAPSDPVTAPSAK